jgi:transcriptional regulator with XRE-family HTH domain
MHGQAPIERRAELREPRTGPAAVPAVVRRARELAGLSQEAAAERAAISKTTWQRVESGADTGTRDRTLIAMARVLNLEPTSLVDLRDGRTTADRMTTTRTREQMIDSLTRALHHVRLEDIAVIEDIAVTRAELRRLQRVRSV